MVNAKEPPPSAAERAYMDASTQTHLDMAVRYTGDADKDFAAVMAAHQKGAAALARIQLQHGKDPGLRQAAERIADAAEKDIAAFDAWRAKHP